MSGKNKTDDNASPGGCSIEHDDEEEKIVIQQRLINIPECFIYRIPPMRSSGGHRAEDWNLEHPLKTCSLEVLQVDDTLVINLMAERPKTNGPPGSTEPVLFARSRICLNDRLNPTSTTTTTTAPTSSLTPIPVTIRPVTHWAEPVTDSSRYFALRIVDDRTGREAMVGLGFRERNDATGFRMALQDYERSVNREREALERARLSMQRIASDADAEAETLPVATGKLSLKEGETIRINLKGIQPKSKKSPSSSSSSSSSSYEGKRRSANVVGKGGLLLKKPPKPADVVDDVPSTTSAQANEPVEEVKPVPPVDAVKADADEEDTEEWGDFQ